MKRYLLPLLTLISVLIFTFTSCATVGRKIDPKAVNSIKKGETTRQQVIQLLGSPDQITKDLNGNITMTYMYVRATAKARSFIPIVGAFIGGANVQNQSVVVTIGPDDKVSNVTATYGSTETDYGVGSGDKPDVSDVEDDKRQK